METNFIGKNRIFLPEVLSTNSYATELLKNVNPEEGTSVLTDNQTKGRGQRGMQWFAAPASNITVSIILKPSFLPLDYYFYLYKIAALACYDTLTMFIDSSQFDIKIKWPNDILVNKKKLCGILIENVLLENKLNWSIIGIGLNVNQKHFDVNLNASSLINLIGKTTDRIKVLEGVFYHLEKYYNLLKTNDYEQIDQLYLSNLFGLNELNWMEYKGSPLQLKVNKINTNGLLVLKDEAENYFEADVKDVKWFLS